MPKWKIVAAMLAVVLTATTTVRADSDSASEMLPICKAVYTGEAAIKSPAWGKFLVSPAHSYTSNSFVPPRA